MVPPEFVFIPVSAVAGAKTSTDILASIDIQRSHNLRGKDDDHSTAFALLQELLRTKISVSDSDDRLHVTPVLEALLKTTNSELDTYLLFMKERNISLQLQVIKKEIEDAKPKKKIKSKSGGPLAEGKLEAEVPLSIEKLGPEKLKTMLIEMSEGIKDIKPATARDPELMKKFFTLWGQVIPYLKLLELQNELIGKPERVNELKELWEKLEKEANTLAKGYSSEPEKRACMITYLTCAHKYAYAPAALNLISDTFAEYMNKHPFASFKKVPGLSGDSKMGGVYVTQAIKRLRDADFDSVDAEVVSKIISDIGGLLDFFRLKPVHVKATDDELMDFLRSGAEFDSRAIHSLLTRSNDPDVFAYVVARHWRLIHMTFPKLQDKNNIRNGFIKLMLERWEVAEADKKEYSEKINKYINMGESAAKPLLPPKIIATFSPPPLPYVSSLGISEAPSSTKVAPTFPFGPLMSPAPKPPSVSSTSSSPALPPPFTKPAAGELATAKSKFSETKDKSELTAKGTKKPEPPPPKVSPPPKKPSKASALPKSEATAGDKELGASAPPTAGGKKPKAPAPKKPKVLPPPTAGDKKPKVLPPPPMLMLKKASTSSSSSSWTAAPSKSDLMEIKSAETKPSSKKVKKTKSVAAESSSKKVKKAKSVAAESPKKFTF